LSDDGGLAELAVRAARRDKWALGRLVQVFEDSRAEGIARRQAVMRQLDQAGAQAHAAIVGFTGTPGAGKSTLAGEVATRLAAADPERAVAVLAIDPSSYRSGGSILGDRTRVRFPVDEPRLFFRSQASEQELGGLGRGTYQVVRLLERLFDYVIVETVGIGQSEVEVGRLADRVYLVLQPMAGDQVQFMKAGIMEAPHVFVLNKWDAGDAARRSFYALRASIDFARPGETEPPRILRTSAVTGEGVDELVGDIETSARAGGSRDRRERYFFEKWVRDEYGRLGLESLVAQGGAEELLRKAGSFEGAQSAYRAPVVG
jgi:LAO/AO transport system kinase